MLHFLMLWLGLDNVSGPQYAFWSGVGMSVFWPLLWWVHHNCHERRCPWPGHPNADGVVYCKGHIRHPKEK
jgi:hypothetical protein